MEIVSELPDLVEMQSKHTMSYILHKNLATGLPIAKALIKYNSNSLEQIDEEEKEPINIELTEQKQILIMVKMLLTLDDRKNNKLKWKILICKLLWKLQK